MNPFCAEWRVTTLVEYTLRIPDECLGHPPVRSKTSTVEHAALSCMTQFDPLPRVLHGGSLYAIGHAGL